MLSKPKYVYESPWFNVTKGDYLTPKNEIVKDFHFIETCNSAIAVISDFNYERFLILKEYRPSLQGEFYTLPGGRIEEGEAPLACLKRELKEETDISCSDFIFLGKTINNGNYHFGEDIVYLALVNFEKIDINVKNEELIMGFEIVDWKTFFEKKYQEVRISGVFSALMLAYIYLTTQKSKNFR